MSEFEHDNQQESRQETVSSTLPPVKPIKTDSVRPVVTYVLIGMTIAVYLGQLISALMFDFDWVAAFGVKSNILISEYHQYWRFITPIFLHSNLITSSGFNPTALMHIGFNMYALLQIGPYLEKVYGHWRFLVLYLLSGFGGVVFSFIFSEYNSLGASTAVFGMFGAQAIFLYLNRQLFRNNASKQIQQIVMLVVVNFMIGLSPGIDNWGHIGGFLAGVAFSYYAGPVMKIVDMGSHYLLKDRRNTGRCLLTATAIFLVLLLVVVVRLA